MRRSGSGAWPPAAGGGSAHLMSADERAAHVRLLAKQMLQDRDDFDTLGLTAERLVRHCLCCLVFSQSTQQI